MSGKSILITGASSGFGLMTAKLALSRGWRVAATARRLEAVPLEVAPALLRLRLDVTDGPSIAGAVEAALSAFGSLDAVVNNAGMAHFGTAEDVSDEAMREEMETNFFGAVAVTKAVLPHMRLCGKGRLVFVSSDWGRTGIPGYTGYCASKHALEGWAESLFHEVKGFGIGITLIEPGAFDTGFAAQVSRGAASPKSPYAKLYEAIDRGFEDEGPAPTGEAVAEAILRAASGEERHLRVPVGADAIGWSSARFKETEEEFIAELARRYGWDLPGAGSR